MKNSILFRNSIHIRLCHLYRITEFQWTSRCDLFYHWIHLIYSSLVSGNRCRASLSTLENVQKYSSFKSFSESFGSNQLHYWFSIFHTLYASNSRNRYFYHWIQLSMDPSSSNLLGSIRQCPLYCRILLLFCSLEKDNHRHEHLHVFCMCIFYCRNCAFQKSTSLE